MNARTSSTVIAGLAAVNPIPKAWRSSNRDGRDKSGQDMRHMGRTGSDGRAR
ncbi:hypothetical protein JKG68_02695 [Microvirga aerilata]|uniref:Uncharacterized protein n=1 Tax=Microvirga aerilata TaxID=670292 RepID=A0A937CW48_9HYPH|nr:hypothetical protein [Microvirga aerilata]MBL0402868.1 hypothetical protein [Microvirga aerilata]